MQDVMLVFLRTPRKHVPCVLHGFISFHCSFIVCCYHPQTLNFARFARKVECVWDACPRTQNCTSHGSTSNQSYNGTLWGKKKYSGKRGLWGWSVQTAKAPFKGLGTCHGSVIYMIAISSVSLSSLFCLHVCAEMKSVH